MVFPVVVHRCESWARKKAECRRIDAFGFFVVVVFVFELMLLNHGVREDS